ncbi:MAG: response regulator transcription factor [Phycisphaerales bacterium]|nr:response regulator transcription factor [Phycisphaerales bacterium]
MAATPTIKLLCVDDNAKLRAAWERLLAREPDVDLVGVLSTADDLVETASNKGADIVLLDLSMEGKAPLDAVAEMARDCPGVKVVIYSASSAPDMVDRAVAAGAWGYVDKLADPDQVIDAIRRVFGGEVVLPGAG